MYDEYFPQINIKGQLKKNLLKKPKMNSFLHQLNFVESQRKRLFFINDLFHEFNVD